MYFLALEISQFCNIKVGFATEGHMARGGARRQQCRRGKVADTPEATTF